MKTIHELMELKGRVATITGGAGHLGQAFAETLAELGADLVLIDLQEEACAEVVSRLQQTYSAQLYEVILGD